VTGAHGLVFDGACSAAGTRGVV
jgi:hypothetical protein